MRSFILITLTTGLTGCCLTMECYRDQLTSSSGDVGGEDVLQIDLPFAAGYTSQCVQGVGGSYSHHYASTYYDVDLDTPNGADDIVYAPAGGVAYVHEEELESGFGRHINLEVSDGTYLVLGHLAESFVENGSEVAAGQLLGFEGTTGYSSGDHVHLGRHDGDPSADASEGTSLEGLEIRLEDTNDGVVGTVLTSDLTCGMSGGSVYASQLATPLWHPSGSLVMTPWSPDVYLLAEGTRRLVDNETAFWSRNWDFGEVVQVDEAELSCYESGSPVTGESSVQAVNDDGTVWLLIGASTETDRTRLRVRSAGWQGVLKSWGISAATYDDLSGSPTSGSLTDWPDEGYAPYRDGSLISEVSSSTVYAVGDGIARPIETWDAFLLMGFAGRTVSEVEAGDVASVMTAVGDCSADVYCITADDVRTCGGPADDATFAEDAGGVDTGATSGFGDETEPEEEEMGENTLEVTWTAPSGAEPDTIVLSGEFSDDGESLGWETLAEVRDRREIVYTRSGVDEGDSLRFSVEFTERGVTSWSCLAPFPPGTLQGTATARWEGETLTVSATADPTSSGCGLQVSVP